MNRKVFKELTTANTKMADGAKDDLQLFLEGMAQWQKHITAWVTGDDDTNTKY